MPAMMWVLLAVLLFTAATTSVNASETEPPTHQQLIRAVLSQPGVLIDMAGMTENGYRWTDETIWNGGGAEGQSWYVAGLLFERPGSAGVWLQYAFETMDGSDELRAFERWYGARVGQ